MKQNFLNNIYRNYHDESVKCWNIIRNGINLCEASENKSFKDLCSFYQKKNNFFLLIHGSQINSHLKKIN